MNPKYAILIIGIMLISLVVEADCLNAQDKQDKKAKEQPKVVAGAAEFLAAVPKRAGLLKAYDLTNRTITLLIDGESLAKVWPLAPDAEVKILGWWGRLDQLVLEDRIWVWFKMDRKKQPVAVSMLADELSEQHIHTIRFKTDARTADSITLKDSKGKPQTHRAGKAEVFLAGKPAKLDAVAIGKELYHQSNKDGVRVLLDAATFESRRTEQKQSLRKRWEAEGLPGTVAFQHIFSGELDFMLDHEAMRWGRSLKTGDKVTLQAQPPISAVVKEVHPWREHTQVRLVVNGVEQADLSPGQRMLLKMPPPSKEVEDSLYPPDMSLPRSKPERIEWFLASIYCTCGVRRDTCTGHFYTLASCNPNACAMPAMVRTILAEKIDAGLSDRQIFDDLLKEQGELLLRPHLLP